MGIPRTLYLAAVSVLLSTSILHTFSFPAYSTEISLRSGATILHGPHQGAQKSISVGTSLSKTSVSKLVSVTFIGLSLIQYSPFVSQATILVGLHDTTWILNTTIPSAVFAKLKLFCNVLNLFSCGRKLISNLCRLINYRNLFSIVSKNRKPSGVVKSCFSVSTIRPCFFKLIIIFEI